MEKNVWRLLLIISILLSAMTFNSFAADQQPAAAQKPAATAAPAQSDSSKEGMERFRDWFHNPTPWLEMGADLRMRWTYGWNLDTLNNDATHRDSNWNWYQNRMRWSLKFKLNDDMDFNIRYAWEFRVWDVPERKNGNGTSAEKRTESTDFSEIVWDQFNLVVRNFGGMPLTMVVGRQDIMLGEGWLICDATPGDAARTAYFDALRFTYNIPSKEKTTLDLIYAENRAAEDWYLKPINDRNAVITQQDERAVILYYTDKSRPSLNLEGYFILKVDNPINYAMKATPTGNDRWNANWSKRANIYTFGGALSGSIFGSEHWKYRAEGAVQTGRKEGFDPTNQALPHTGMKGLMAFGTVDRIEYHFNDAKKNKLRGSFEYLSGDKPGTGKSEAFDPLWGEWPRISETLLYVYNLETQAGEVTNLYRAGLGHSIQLTEKMSMDTDIHWLWADQNTRKNFTHSSGLGFSDTGKYRGTLATWCLKYAFTKNLKGNILLEYFQPGNYYASGSRDAAYFARVNLDYTF
ncbi:MAG: hypothetical protein ABR969_09960 [Sedimentisphaerales bacterium]